MTEIGFLRDAGAVLAVGNALIIAHELGHYLAARATGTTPTRFAIGVGPRLLQHTDRRGTSWRLSALPIGGYVVMPDHAGPRPRSTGDQLRRLAVIAAGPLANVLLAIAIFAASLATIGETAFLPIAGFVAPASAAAAAGFQPGDRIIRMDGRPVALFEDMRPTLRAGAGTSS